MGKNSMTTPEKTNLGRFISLSVMMFALFFVWGAWYVTMGSFMVERGMSADLIGWAYSVAPIAAIITPFFMGVFADRFVNAEKLQGVLLFLSGILICIAPRFATPGITQCLGQSINIRTLLTVFWGTPCSVRRGPRS